MNGNDSRINILDMRRLVDNVYANDIIVQIYRTDVSKEKKHQQCYEEWRFFLKLSLKTVNNCEHSFRRIYA